MQSMSGCIKPSNRLANTEKLHFKVLTFEKPIENRAIAVLQCVYTQVRASSDGKFIVFYIQYGQQSRGGP